MSPEYKITVQTFIDKVNKHVNNLFGNPIELGDEDTTHLPDSVKTPILVIRDLDAAETYFLDDIKELDDLYLQDTETAERVYKIKPSQRDGGTELFFISKEGDPINIWEFSLKILY